MTCILKLHDYFKWQSILLIKSEQITSIRMYDRVDKALFCVGGYVGKKSSVLPVGKYWMEWIVFCGYTLSIECLIVNILKKPDHSFWEMQHPSMNYFY